MANLEQIRIYSFFSLLILFLILEYLKPSFPKQKYKDHLKVNMLLFISSIVVLRLSFPFGLYSLAGKISEAHSSLLGVNQLPLPISAIITILCFDLAIYWQHRLFHIIPFLWRSHKVHHSDLGMDITTAVRFHPVEIFISGLYKIIIMLILGPKAEIYLIYEVLLNGFALFTHANFKIPTKLDHFLRYLFVTPAMHYPHHSPHLKLTNMNYGNILSIWDRIFKSYTQEVNSVFGIDTVTDKDAKSIKSQLNMAFHK